MIIGEFVSAPVSFEAVPQKPNTTAPWTYKFMVDGKVLAEFGFQDPQAGEQFMYALYRGMELGRMVIKERHDRLQECFA